jgi:hypothetical protein
VAMVLQFGAIHGRPDRSRSFVKPIYPCPCGTAALSGRLGNGRTFVPIGPLQQPSVDSADQSIHPRRCHTSTSVYP